MIVTLYVRSMSRGPFSTWTEAVETWWLLGFIPVFRRHRLIETPVNGHEVNDG